MRSRVEITEVRRALAAARSRESWRSLEDLARTPEFIDVLRHEFPRQAAVLDAGGVGRREFLKLMGASMALAGLGACTRQPAQTIVPYVRQPEQLVLGEPLEFATAVPQAGFAIGILVESHDGRPAKIEGNPEHPASLGASDAVSQASILSLYDPDRAQAVTSVGSIRTWSAFRAALKEALTVERARRGAGLRLLTETVTSPTLAHQIEALLAEFPRAQWHQYQAAGGDPARVGSRKAFGRFVDTRYDFEQADIVVSLDADVFGTGPGRLRYLRDFSRRRRLERGDEGFNRLYVLESMPSITGATADHRLAVGARDVEHVARALAAAVGVGGLAPPRQPDTAVQGVLGTLARDLTEHRGRGVIVAGEQLAAEVHALAHAINHALGNVGRTVVHTEPVEARPVEQLASLRQLVADIETGAVELLLILGGNPVYDAPADLGVAEALRKVPLRIHLSPYEDETATLCHWHIPEAHYLESWSDARAFDGTVTILQPLIEPLYGGKTAHELIDGCLQEEVERSSYDIVRGYWMKRHGGADFETFWRRALHDGVVPDTSLPPTPVRLQPNWHDASPAATDSEDQGGGLEIVFRPDPHVLDGRLANNGWLQELPKPITRLTWDNAALLSPATAGRLGLANGDLVELRLGERSVRGPVWIVPGHAADSVTVHLGYGRTRAGRVGNGLGFNAYVLRTATAPHFAQGLQVRRIGERYPLATTQDHGAMEGRHLVRAATLQEYRAHPDFAQHVSHEPPADLTLYPGHEYPGHAWGMAIDLSSCVGCNACTLACQAENNIPVVGKAQVMRGREMHWIRVDRYFAGDLDAPAIYHQPIPCMHCENAPCEVVCPVNATVHSSEGLNEMVYNRCVGTRYCSNNCPYKVRRFNFYLYTSWHDETVKMAMNPDVTVRSRGVMEKCTYCVQRIERGRIAAGREGRALRDGDIVVACQQACPTQAIVFGDINDPESRVAQLKSNPRNYGLLTDRNTLPRTTYLAIVRNPSPELDHNDDGAHS